MPDRCTPLIYISVPRLGMPASEVLRFEHVDYFRGDREILTDINLTVNAGEHWALIGPNGSGKSTLLRVCGAERIPSRGDAYVLGNKLGRVDIRTLRESIGHVNPRIRLHPRRTVQQIVLTGVTGTTELMNHWQPTEDELARADHWTHTLGLDEFRTATWETMSQGERGRTLIARALMAQPALILLDEPSTGLDLVAREKLLGIVDELHESQAELATILVTHHLEELPATTTHAALLKEGRVLAAGTIGEVLTSELVSDSFEFPISVEHDAGRWSARGAGRG